MDLVERVYRNIDRRHQPGRLELSDAFCLGLAFLVLLKGFPETFWWNVFAVIVLAGVVRLLKRGRPPGTTKALLKFYVSRRPRFSALAPDLEGRAQPWSELCRRWAK